MSPRGSSLVRHWDRRDRANRDDATGLTGATAPPVWGLGNAPEAVEVSLSEFPAHVFSQGKQSSDSSEDQLIDDDENKNTQVLRA